MMKHRLWTGLFCLAGTVLLALGCSNGKLRPGGLAHSVSYQNPLTPLTITEKSDLIGGPAAVGRVGDVLLSNDQIRVIIQKPGKSAGIGSFGGTIIDADRVRSPGAGNDHWGDLFPMINIEWTVNYYDYVVLSDGKNGGEQVLRAFGAIDTYDFLDIDWIADAAQAALGQRVAFADRFDDRRDPFNNVAELAGLSWDVTTDYTLEPGANFVKIETTLTNPSDAPIQMPVGEFIAGGGELQLLIPGLGFSPPVAAQVGGNTPAVLFPAFPGGDISYGYFYELAPLVVPADASAEMPERLLRTASVTYSGMTGVLLGEEFLKVLPVGSNVAPEINFTIPPKQFRKLTSYFVVGDGSAGSLLDTGLRLLNIPAASIVGKVALKNGAPVSGATVAVKNAGGDTVTTYVSDAKGEFSGRLSTGSGTVGKALGSGVYEIWVEKPGYHENGTLRAGSCSPSQIDLTGGATASLVCTLGNSGTVKLSGGVADLSTGEKIPARLTIVGEDPSPETSGAGTFSDIRTFERPFGITDVLLINAKGGIGLSSKTGFDLEPGTYRFVFSHGPEYSIYEKVAEVPAGGVVTLENVGLRRIVKTSGFVSADFHIHALPSPDSFFSIERRALAAAADGLDILQSSDHDFLTDYGPVVKKLQQAGWLSQDSIATVVGDEITPNHYGHLQAFPLVPDPDRPDHGAIDWSAHALDEISPAPDYVMSPREIIAQVLLDPGEEVIQVNHIADGPTGLPVASGWLTTPIYSEQYGVPPFVAYSDPVERRLNPAAGKPAMLPYSMAHNELIFDTFTAVELTIGPHMSRGELWESALPTWFNLLNLGLLPTATGSSDSHHEIGTPLGIPRNFVASNVDPRDGMGLYSQFDEEFYAARINERKVIVSAGPFIRLQARNTAGEKAGVGDILHGTKITIILEVEAPDWAWFDTIEIYANTEPLPAEDTSRFALEDEAADPAVFAAPYHVPHYIYEAAERFRLTDGTLKSWKLENGKISARVELTLKVAEDTWVVAVARGTRETEGYRSLFPVVPHVITEEGKTPELFDPADLTEFHKDPAVGAPAWAFTNPVFIDVDGDTDGDGFDFEAKWVRQGFSTLKPFIQ